MEMNHVLSIEIFKFSLFLDITSEVVEWQKSVGMNNHVRHQREIIGIDLKRKVNQGGIQGTEMGSGVKYKDFWLGMLDLKQ